MKNTNETQQIAVGNMNFIIVDEYPDDIDNDKKEQIERELFNVFKKYETKDNK